MKLDKKTPIKEKPLRLPGQSIGEKIQDIMENEVLSYSVMVIFSIVLALLEWYRWYIKDSFHPFFFSFIAFAIVLFCLPKLFKIKLKLKNHKLGLEGERAVADELDALKEKGFRIFHDIIGENFNIDHVIICSKGIFSIETKTISKPSKGKAEISYNGQTLLINNDKPERNPIVQAEAQARWLKNMLKESTGKIFNVQPIVVYPGWYVLDDANNLQHKVWVLNPKRLNYFIEDKKEIIQNKDLHLVVFHLSRYIKTC